MHTPVCTEKIHSTYITQQLKNKQNVKVIEKCTNIYFGTEKLPPKF